MKRAIQEMWQKWNIDSDESNVNYDVGNEIIYNTKVLKYYY